MTKEKLLVREIVGPVRNEIDGFACAIQETGKLLFEENRDFGEIMVTRDIYPAVSRAIRKDIRTVARQIERMENLCWDSMDRAQKLRYVGRVLNDINAPQDMIFYLAFYIHFRKPFYEIMKEEFWNLPAGK